MQFPNEGPLIIGNNQFPLFLKVRIPSISDLPVNLYNNNNDNINYNYNNSKNNHNYNNSNNSNNNTFFIQSGSVSCNT